MPSAKGRAAWLVLAYQLPARPPHLRVRIWRRLQQVGAVLVRNSIYVLPNTGEAREDLEWIRAEIVAHRGQASLLEASALDGATDTDVTAQLRADRDAEYRAFIKQASRTRGVRKLKEQLAAIVKRDYVDTPSRRDAERLVAEIERELGHQLSASDERPRLRTRDFQGRVWLTRPHPGIDRMASAWLIRRFIDARATFTFAGSVSARDRRRVPFDMADVEFGHHGTRCTFETLVQRFGIADAAVRPIAEIVHDLDLKETRFGRPEAVAVGRIVEGLRASKASDAELLDRGMSVIEALYQSFRRS